LFKKKNNKNKREPQQAKPTFGQRQNLMHLHLTRKGSCNSCNGGATTVAATKKLPMAKNKKH